MSDDVPDRPPTARFLDALEVTRNAKLGIATGVALTAAIFLFFVVLAPSTSEPPVLYLGLGFVLATALAMAVTLVLTVRSAIRLSRRFDDERDEDERDRNDRNAESR